MAGRQFFDTSENVTLVYLRRLDEKIDRLGTDMREVKERLGMLEHQYASVSRRLDTLDQLERIERRLDLNPAS
jgi:septation ring formation regulator EzrA